MFGLVRDQGAPDISLLALWNDASFENVDSKDCWIGDYVHPFRRTVSRRP